MVVWMKDGQEYLCVHAGSTWKSWVVTHGPTVRDLVLLGSVSSAVVGVHTQDPDGDNFSIYFKAKQPVVMMAHSF